MEKVTKGVYFHQQYICPRRPALLQQVENIQIKTNFNRILLLVFVCFVFTGPLILFSVYNLLPVTTVIIQELSESRGGRPGLSVLTSLLVSVDVKLY